MERAAVRMVKLFDFGGGYLTVLFHINRQKVGWNYLRENSF